MAGSAISYVAMWMGAWWNATTGRRHFGLVGQDRGLVAAGLVDELEHIDVGAGAGVSAGGGVVFDIKPAGDGLTHVCRRNNSVFAVRNRFTAHCGRWHPKTVADLMMWKGSGVFAGLVLAGPA